jgi:peptidoglycan-N-acetylglucosamine deacetylase
VAARDGRAEEVSKEVSVPNQGAPDGTPDPAVYRRRRGVALLALVLLVATPILALSLSAGDRRPRRPGLTRENRAALRGAGTVLAALDGMAFAGPMASHSDQRKAVERFVAMGRPLYCGGRRGRYLALTFDDGPGDQTIAVLRALRSAGQRATFFLLGKQILEEPALPRLERAAGAVGDHSFSHAELPRVNDRRLEEEIMRTQDMLAETSGGPVTLFRPPYGMRNWRTDRLVRKLGMLEVLWNVDTEDGRRAGPETIYRLAVEGMRPGSIILMHESAPNTLTVLPRILAELKRRGLRSVSVPELLALQPPSEAQVRAGGMGCAVTRDPVPGSGSHVP